MIIGKWNKSVILTYVGMLFSILGIFIIINNKENILISLSCLIIAGICDLFDGAIARKCKRTEEEKKFGIELDSLVDVINFIAFPMVIFMNINLKTYFDFIVIFVFSLCGIARLAYFNISVEDSNTPIKYYKGLPVTYTALIYPLAYLLKYAIIEDNIFNIVFSIITLLIAILNVLNIKIIKPKGKAYLFFSILAIGMLVLFLGVL